MAGNTQERVKEMSKQSKQTAQTELWAYPSYEAYVNAMKSAGKGGAANIEPDYVWKDARDKYLANLEESEGLVYDEPTDEYVPKGSNPKEMVKSKAGMPSNIPSEQTQTQPQTPSLNTWQERIKAGKASDADIQEGYRAWKEGKYNPGPLTLKEFEKMDATNKPTETEEAPQETIDKIDTDGDGQISPEEAQDPKNKGLLEKLFGAYRKGELDMYPTLKAVIDSVAKNAQMTADRANILTGKGSDTSIYTPIETETDIKRASTIEDRAEAERMASAIDKAKNGDWSEFSAMQAAGQVSIEQIADSMAMDKEEVQKLMEEGTIARLERPVFENEKAKADFKTDLNRLALSYRQEATKLRSDATRLEKTDDYSVAQEMLNTYRTIYTGQTSVSSTSESEAASSGSSTGLGGGAGKWLNLNLGDQSDFNVGSQTANTLSNDKEWTSRMGNIEAQMKKAISDTSLANKDIAAIMKQMADSYDEEATRLENEAKDI